MQTAVRGMVFWLPVEVVIQTKAMGLRIIMRGNKKEKVKDEDQIAFNQDPMSHYLIKIHQNSVICVVFLSFNPSKHSIS